MEDLREILIGTSRSAYSQLRQHAERGAYLAKLEQAAKGLTIERVAALAWAESVVGKTVYRIGSDDEGDPVIVAYQIKGYHTVNKKKKFRFDAVRAGTKNVVSMNLKHCHQDRQSAERAIEAMKGDVEL